MSDTDEWQKSEAHRRDGPADGTSHEHGHEDPPQLTERQVERIEDDVREEVAATDPAISDS